MKSIKSGERKVRVLKLSNVFVKGRSSRRAFYKDVNCSDEY